MRCLKQTTKGKLLPKKVLLVSKDLGKECFLNHLGDLAKIAETEKCHTLMLALHSVNDNDGQIKVESKQVFGETRSFPKIVILESGSIDKEITFVEVFSRMRGKITQKQFVRHFATSTAGKTEKQKLIAEFETRSRHFDKDQALVICGEANVIKTKRPNRAICDEFQFLDLLKKTKTKILMNPWHTYCKRPEANWKRAALSSNGRTVISVWNRWEGTIRGETKLPWVAFHNGQNVTQKIKEIKNPFAERPDIRIGSFAIS